MTFRRPEKLTNTKYFWISFKCNEKTALTWRLSDLVGYDDKGMTNRLLDIKIWVPIALFSLLAHTLYWNLQTVEQTLVNFPGPYLSNVVPAAGSVLRIIGILVALLSVYLVWGPPAKSFADARGKVSIALFLEGVYYITFIPTAIFLIVQVSALQGVLYGLFTLMMAPLLTILSLKVRARQGAISGSVLRWAGAAGLGYIIALWVTTVANWVDAGLTFGISFIASGTTYVSLLNSVITLSLALVFALLGLIPIINKGKSNMSAKRWCGLSLIMLGAYFTIYVLSAVLTNNLNAALLGDIWLISSLGIGASLFQMETR